MSIRPGSTVAWLRSMTLAPAGIWILSAGPTSTILSPLMRMTWLSKLVPDLGSNSRPALLATPSGGGDSMFKLVAASKGIPTGLGVCAQAPPDVPQSKVSRTNHNIAFSESIRRIAGILLNISRKKVFHFKKTTLTRARKPTSVLRRADGPALETTHPDLPANALKTSIDNCRAIPRGSYSIERISVARNMFVIRTFVLTENESEVQLHSCIAFRRGGLYLATGFGKQMERYSREKNRRLQSHLAREVLPRFAESSRNDDGDHETKRGDSDDGRPRRALQSDGRIRRLSTDFVSGRPPPP